MFFDCPPPGYSFEDLVGTGGFSTVYKGRNLESGKTVAIKVVRTNKYDPKVKENFLAEANLLKQLYHKNIVHFINLTQDEKHIFLIMEFVEGVTLKKYVENRGKLDEDETRKIFGQIVDAVSYFHFKTGLLHRDLKSDNIMINENTKKIKLIDFGLAGVYSADNPNQFCGSPSMYNVFLTKKKKKLLK